MNMARRKIPEEKKKVNFNISIDPEISRVFDEFLEENGVYNKSNYIENVIKEILIENKKLNK